MSLQDKKQYPLIESGALKVTTNDSFPSSLNGITIECRGDTAGTGVRGYVNVVDLTNALGYNAMNVLWEMARKFDIKANDYLVQIGKKPQAHLIRMESLGRGEVHAIYRPMSFVSVEIAIQCVMASRGRDAAQCRIELLDFLLPRDNRSSNAKASFIY